MEVTAKDQDKVRNGIVILEGMILKWYKFNRITKGEKDEAFLQLKRIDSVCKVKDESKKTTI
jgi:hypothetical protein